MGPELMGDPRPPAEARRLSPGRRLRDLSLPRRCPVHVAWQRQLGVNTPSLTLFEVALFLAAKPRQPIAAGISPQKRDETVESREAATAIRLLPSCCRRFAANTTFFDLTHGSRRGLGAAVATRLTNSATSKLTLRVRNKTG